MEILSLYPKAFILSFASIVSFLWVMYAVFIRKNFNKKIYKVYLFYALSFTLWILSNAYFYSPLLTALDKSYAVKMGLFANIICFIGVILAFYFSCLLSGNGKIKLWEKFFILSITLGNFALNLTPNLTVTDIKFLEDGRFQLIQGDAVILFSIIGILTIILTFKNFFNLRKSKIRMKQQKAYYMLTGVSILLTSIFVFDIFIPLFFKNYNYVWLPPIFTLAEIALFGYALLTQIFYSNKHLFQKALTHVSNAAVYIIPLIIAVFICHNNSALNNPLTVILIYSTFILGNCIFNKKTFGFFDKLFNLIIYKSPLSKARQIRQFIKEMPNTSEEINDWLKKFQDILKVKGAEFAYAGETSFNDLSGYFDGDYSECILKDTLDHKIAKHFGANGKAAKLTDLKKKMETESIALAMPVVNKKGEPTAIFIVKDKIEGKSFTYEELSQLRILPEQAIRIVLGKDKVYKKAGIITQDVLNALNKQVDNITDTLNKAELKKNIINRPYVIATSLEQLILFIHLFIDSMKYRANLIKADKEQVNLNEIFDNTLEELELDKSVNNSDYEISFEIADNIKDRTFLLDEDLITQAFYQIGVNGMQFNDSAKKELKVKAFVDDNNLILDFQDNGIGVQEKDFDKIFEPLIAKNRDYRCQDCENVKCKDCRHQYSADGVGLTYAKGIIKAHNGKVFVLKSQPGKTIIRVMLPIKKEIGDRKPIKESN